MNWRTEYNMRVHEAAFQETIATDMHGFLTKFAWQTNTGISAVLMPLSFLNPITTSILGLIGGLTFYIAVLPFYAIGALMIVFLLGTSWLWLKAPILRPLLFLPGVLTAPLCGRYIGWMPAYRAVDIRLASINACFSWPLTAAVWRRVVSAGETEIEEP